MAKVTIRHLQEIDGELRYRRRVPDDIRHAVGRQEWVHALGLPIGQERLAASLVAEYDAAYARLITQERVRVLHEKIGSRPVMLGAAPSPICGGEPHRNQPAQPPKPAPKVPLSEAYSYDLNVHGGARNERSFQNAIDCMTSLSGDVDIMALAAKDVQRWINACLDKGLRPSTIGRYINVLRAVVNRYYRDHEIERRNPFSSPQIKDAGGANTDRLPFHKSHLKLIDCYLREVDKPSDDARRIIALLRLTGARPLEIGGLDAQDLVLDHEFPHIWVRNNRHRRIKTKGSERRIPLVGPALEAAQAAKTDQPTGALFPPACHDTNSLSQRLNKLIRRAGVPKSPRLVVYSFRHTLEEALRAAGVREHTQKRIMGHSDSSMTGRYGAPAGMLEELHRALTSAAPLLGRVDLSIFSAEERA